MKSRLRPDNYGVTGAKPMSKAEFRAYLQTAAGLLKSSGTCSAAYLSIHQRGLMRVAASAQAVADSRRAIEETALLEEEWAFDNIWRTPIQPLKVGPLPDHKPR